MNETYIYIQLQNKIKLQKGRNKAQRWKNATKQVKNYYINY